ncbi:MAG: YfcC family protein, partial [Bacteroidota bacterium]
MLKGKKIPHTYVIVFSIIVLAAALTWFFPGGEFERETRIVHGTEREVIIQDSFTYTESEPQTWQIFSALFEGFVDKADIIVFILIIGGAFWIINESRAIDVGIFSFLKYSRKLERFKFMRKLGVNNLIITLIMLIFSIFGATFGMSEETIAFIIIFVPLAISMGYDSIVGVSMCFVAAGLGFAGALLNPFTIGIAQGLSNLPLFSGIEYRLFCWVVINVIGIAWVLRYAHKVKKHPTKSPVYEIDEYWRKKDQGDTEDIKYYTPRGTWIAYVTLSIILIVIGIFNPITTMTIGNNSFNAPMLPITGVLFAISGIFAGRKSLHFFVLHLLGFTILYLIIGVMGYGWYVMEIATLFLAMGIFAGIAMS